MPTAIQGPALVCSAAVLGLTALMAAEPALGRRRPSSTREQWWLRPSLLTVCLGGACLTLGFALTSHSVASASRLQAGPLLRGGGGPGGVCPVFGPGGAPRGAHPAAPRPGGARGRPRIR